MKNSKPITCRICGAEFEQTAPNQKYCCIICAAVGRKQKRKEWEESHPGYNALYAAKNKSTTPPENERRTRNNSSRNVGNLAEGRS